MVGIALLAIHNDRDNTMQLAMLAEQALPVQVTGVYVPDSHLSLLALAL